MPLELSCLAWTLVLGIVHIIVAAQARTHQYGIKWNASARDEQQAPLNPVAGRLVRAQANFFETFPLFACAILIAAIASKFSTLTHWGSLIYLIARVIYIPLYALGIPMVRSLIWVVSMIGLGLILFAILVP